MNKTRRSFGNVKKKKAGIGNIFGSRHARFKECFDDAWRGKGVVMVASVLSGRALGSFAMNPSNAEYEELFCGHRKGRG
eukprot:12401044-Karenia_brevis.AAC.1